MGIETVIAVVVPVAVVAILLLGAFIWAWRHRHEATKKVDHTALAKRWFMWNPNQDLLPGKAHPNPADKRGPPLQAVIVSGPREGRDLGELRTSRESGFSPQMQSFAPQKTDFAPPILGFPSHRRASSPRSNLSPRPAASAPERSLEKNQSFGSGQPGGGQTNSVTSALPSPRTVFPLTPGADWLASRSFTLREILVATDYFNQKYELGSGGFGKVYQGELKDGVTVAIKRMKKESKQGMREFINEVRLLGRLRHTNLVQLVGFCATEEEQLLCYEYMANGNLAQHLRGTKKPLSWRMRLEVAIGAAKGLDYLHVIATPPVIHRDVKSSNILLDADWNAKVADFGLSKAVQTNSNLPSSSTFVRGTPGYFDPEYYEGQRLTEKSDVYAFGVVLLEMLTGKKPIDDTLPLSDGSLAKWARPHLRDPERAVSIVDPRIQGSMSRASVLKFAGLALQCVSLQGDDRPSMSEVVLRLQEAIAS